RLPALARLGLSLTPVTTGDDMVPVHTDLRGADLRGAGLSEATIGPETEVDDRSLFGPTSSSRPSEIVKDGNAAVYRQLKLAFQDSGDYMRAGDFFLREMQHRRREQIARRSWRRWSLPYLISLSFDILSGYGERPSRVLLWGAVLVFIFMGIHSSLGIWTDGPDGPMRVTDLGHALYFSVVTFTTLGYGDYRPSPGWGQFFSSAEALLGVVLMSLFLVCTVRKFSR
ncbi:MAG: hypothetical protein GF320_13130, partial [Armatimonadia bacterium]|nr:hypothetical protein [Armatimonadia bacterium]